MSGILVHTYQLLMCSNRWFNFGGILIVEWNENADQCSVLYAYTACIAELFSDFNNHDHRMHYIWPVYRVLMQHLLCIMSLQFCKFSLCSAGKIFMNNYIVYNKGIIWHTCVKSSEGPLCLSCTLQFQLLSPGVEPIPEGSLPLYNAQNSTWVCNKWQLLVVNTPMSESKDSFSIRDSIQWS